MAEYSTLFVGLDVDKESVADAPNVREAELTLLAALDAPIVVLSDPVPPLLRL